MQNKYPYWAICPITQEIMVDPVIAADGRTYERVAIERLIAKNPRGPVFIPGSNSPLIHSYLIPNHLMLGEIRAWLKSQSTLVQEKYENARLRLQLLELNEPAPWEDVLSGLPPLEADLPDQDDLPSLEDVPADQEELPPLEADLPDQDDLPSLEDVPADQEELPPLEDVPMKNERTELDELAELEHFKEENISLKEELTQRTASKWSAKKDTAFRLVSALEGDLQNAADNTIYLDDRQYYIRDPRIGRVRKNPLPADLGVRADNLAEKLQDLTFQQKLREDIEEKGYFLQQAFFEKMTQGVTHKIVRATVNAEPKLTFSEARNLALAGRPGISECFQVAIGGAHFMVTKLLDLVRRGLDAEADAIIEQDPGLLNIKGGKFSILFLHMLRFPWPVHQSADVTGMRKADPDLLPDAELRISEFLVRVSTGNLIETEIMLQEDPTLLLKKGRLVDFGLRRFTEKVEGAEAAGITGLQYADAADDEPMQDLLKRYWPEGRREEIDKQLAESRNEKGNNNYKALEELRHSIETLRDALGGLIRFIARFEEHRLWDRAPYKKQIAALWRKVVEAQLKLPAWVIHLWLEPGEKVAWYDASDFGSREGGGRYSETLRLFYDLVVINESVSKGLVRSKHYYLSRERILCSVPEPEPDQSRFSVPEPEQVRYEIPPCSEDSCGDVPEPSAKDVLEKRAFLVQEVPLTITILGDDYKKFSQLSAKRAAAPEDYRDDSLPATSPRNFNG